MYDVRIYELRNLAATVCSTQQVRYYYYYYYDDDDDYYYYIRCVCDWRCSC
jgi:hypothetical protein